MAITRIIWSWSQAEERVADLSLRLERANPGWSVRVLSVARIGTYVDLSEIWPGHAHEAGAATATDILRLALLHEFGGVWIDESLELLEPLDGWIAASAGQGFFAFADAADIPSPTFIAAEEGNHLVASWLVAALDHVHASEATGPQWLAHAFRKAATRDDSVRRAWSAVPRLPLRASASEVDLRSSTAPVAARGSQHPRCERSVPLRTELRNVEFAGLSVSTRNLGDNMQIIAMEQMLRRLGLAPSLRLDRDRGLGGGDWLHGRRERLPILINGWLMHEPAAWPPHQQLDATLFGVFFQIASAPRLIDQASLRYYAAGPAIGCRDAFTMNLLKSRGIDAYLSHCTTMGFPRRLPASGQVETFVVAPDEALLSALKADPRFSAEIGNACVSLSHYPGSSDFETNSALAQALLETYRTRARLVVTSMLHCALPAMAMGIPVVVIAPMDVYKHETDVVRLADLARFVRVFDVTELDQVNWSGYRAELGQLKVDMLDRVEAIVSSWPATDDVDARSDAPGAVNRPSTDKREVNIVAPQQEQPSTPDGSMRIPRVFHRVWLGDRPMPEEYVHFGQTWLDHHPGWELRTWSERELTNLVNKRYFEGAQNYSEKSDFARYEILLRHGGVYVDCDVECLANIEPVISDVEGFIGMEDETWFGSAIVGATPGHPFISRLVSELPKSYENHRREIPGDPNWYAQSARCGPVFVTREYIRARAELPEKLFRVFPPEMFHPRPAMFANGAARANVFARHHMAGSWLPEADVGSVTTPAPDGASIPKVFHRVWLDGPMPAQVQRWGESWLQHHPAWTMKTWGYEDLRDLVNQTDFDNASSHAERSDFARYEILLRHGGVYLANEFECERNIEPLLTGLSGFAATDGCSPALGGIVGAVPGHPFIRELVERLPASRASVPTADQQADSGPDFLNRAFEDITRETGDPLYVYPAEYFYPYRSWEKARAGDPAPEAYATYHWEWNESPVEGSRDSDPELPPSPQPAHDVVVLVSADNPRQDWPVLGGVAHLMVGTGAKLTIAAPPNAFAPEFIDYLGVVDEKLGGVVPIEITDTDRLAGEADVAVVTTVADAFEAVCHYLQRTGRAWLPIHTEGAKAYTGAEPRPFNSDECFRPEHVKLLAAVKAPDTQRWGNIRSYPEGWNPRADIAANMVDDGGSLLEIGVGAGYFKSIIEDRVAYQGLDLSPVIPGVKKFNLESDELPAPRYDCIVALGVLEYVHDFDRAVSLLTDSTDTLVLSYCFAEPGYEQEDFRLGLGWVNGLLQDDFLDKFTDRGFKLGDWRDYTSDTGWHQAVFRLERLPGATREAGSHRTASLPQHVSRVTVSGSPC